MSRPRFLSGATNRTVYGKNGVDEGVVDIDRANYTEWALKERGYVLRKEGQWLTGFYHWNTPGSRIGDGDETRPEKLDSDGLNEVGFVPIGEDYNVWAEDAWSRFYPNIYAWYKSDDMRAWRRRSLLMIKSDTYVHTEGV